MPVVGWRCVQVFGVCHCPATRDSSLPRDRVGMESVVRLPHLQVFARRGPEFAENCGHVRPPSPVAATVEPEKTRMCRSFSKPSDGLEPSTPPYHDVRRVDPCRVSARSCGFERLASRCATSPDSCAGSARDRNVFLDQCDRRNQPGNDDSYSLYGTRPVRLALIACTTFAGIGVHRAGM